MCKNRHYGGIAAVIVSVHRDLVWESDDGLFKSSTDHNMEHGLVAGELTSTQGIESLTVPRTLLFGHHSTMSP